MYIFFLKRRMRDTSKPLEDRRADAIDTMTRRRWEIDKEGGDYIQFRRNLKSAAGSFILFLVGVLFCFVMPPVGIVILAIWFIRLFFSGKGETRLVRIPAGSAFKSRAGS